MLGLFILAVNLAYIFLFFPLKIFENFPYFIILIPMLIGGFFIEYNNSYLFEIEKTAYPNGSFLKNLFFYFLFLELLSKNVVSKKEVSVKINYKFIEIIILILISMVYFYFSKTGIPLLKNIHRTTYFNSMVPYYINFIKGRFSFLCLCCGFLFSKTKSKRFIFYWILIIFYYILCSVKGGDIFLMIWYFSLPVVLLKQTDRKKYNLNSVRKYIIIFFICSFSLLFIAYKKYENYNKSTTPIEKIVKRFEAAGQIWWFFSDSKQIKPDYRLDKFSDNFNVNKSNFDKGMQQLMTEIVPKHKLEIWRQKGARYQSLANGFPAIGYYHFNILGCIILICIIGTFIQYLKKFILRACVSDDIFSLLFLSVLLEVSTRIVAQGDIQLLLEKRTIAIVALIIMYKFIKLVVKR